MNKRTIRIIILSVIVIFLLAAVAYFLFMFRFPGSTIPKAIEKKIADQVVNIKNHNSPVATTSLAKIIKQTNAQPASSEAITKANLMKTAESFAARLGSYSNQSNFGNISQLKLYMTASMQSWADKYIAANQKTDYSGVYQGVTTQAISAEIKNFDDAKGQADVLVHTQKITQSGSGSPVTSYQDITITLIKQNNNWLVDNAVWKK